MSNTPADPNSAQIRLSSPKCAAPNLLMRIGAEGIATHIGAKAAIKLQQMPRPAARDGPVEKRLSACLSMVLFSSCRVGRCPVVFPIFAVVVIAAAGVFSNPIENKTKDFCAYSLQRRNDGGNCAPARTSGASNDHDTVD